MKSPEFSHFKTIEEINRLRESKNFLKSELNSTPKKAVEFTNLIRKGRRPSTNSYKMLRKSTIRSFSNKDLERKIKMYNSYGTRIKWIDIFTMMFNLGTISTFYIEHFEYLENGFKLNSRSNIIRGILLFVSILIAIGIFFRYKLNENSLKIISKLNNSDLVRMLYSYY